MTGNVMHEQKSTRHFPLSQKKEDANLQKKRGKIARIMPKKLAHETFLTSTSRKAFRKEKKFHGKNHEVFEDLLGISPPHIGYLSKDNISPIVRETPRIRLESSDSTLPVTSQSSSTPRLPAIKISTKTKTTEVNKKLGGKKHAKSSSKKRQRSNMLIKDNPKLSNASKKLKVRNLNQIIGDTSVDALTSEKPANPKKVKVKKSVQKKHSFEPDCSFDDLISENNSHKPRNSVKKKLKHPSLNEKENTRQTLPAKIQEGRKKVLHKVRTLKNSRPTERCSLNSSSFVGSRDVLKPKRNHKASPKRNSKANPMALNCSSQLINLQKKNVDLRSLHKTRTDKNVIITNKKEKNNKFNAENVRKSDSIPNSSITRELTAVRITRSSGSSTFVSSATVLSISDNSGVSPKFLKILSHQQTSHSKSSSIFESETSIASSELLDKQVASSKKIFIKEKIQEASNIDSESTREIMKRNSPFVQNSNDEASFPQKRKRSQEQKSIVENDITSQNGLLSNDSSAIKHLRKVNEVQKTQTGVDKNGKEVNSESILKEKSGRKMKKISKNAREIASSNHLRRKKKRSASTEIESSRPRKNMRHSTFESVPVESLRKSGKNKLLHGPTSNIKGSSKTSSGSACHSQFKSPNLHVEIDDLTFSCSTINKKSKDKGRNLSSRCMPAQCFTAPKPKKIGNSSKNKPETTDYFSDLGSQNSIPLDDLISITHPISNRNRLKNTSKQKEQDIPLEINKPVSPSKERTTDKHKKVRPSKKKSEKSSSMPRKGTLKQKRWIVKTLNDRNVGYEDDLFDAQRFNGLKAAFQMDDDFDTPAISTPKPKFLFTPAAAKGSPRFKDCISPLALDDARKNAEEYMFRRNKNKNGGPGYMLNVQAGTSSPRINQSSMPEKRRLNFQEAFQNVMEIQKLSQKNNQDDEEDADSYMSDISM